jgi:two-component system phosphate regulon response regulator PhoB
MWIGDIVFLRLPPLIRETLGLALQEQGYRVCAVADGKTALNLICTDQRQESFDLVILDLILPQVSGLDVCQALRSQGSNVPVLVVSAKSSEIDRVVGLEIGADDYLAKPFGIREFVARCHALLRHHQSVPVRLPGQVLRVKAVEMHLECHQVLVRGKEVLLSPKEYRLLELLMTYPGRIWP